MKEKKRVVFLVRGVNPEFYGGGESYQLMLAEKLKKNGFWPVIVTSSKRLLDEADKKNIENVELPYLTRQNFSGWRNLLLPMYFIWQIRLRWWYRSKIKQYKPVVMNIQSRDDWIAGTKAGMSLNVKIIWTDHIDFRTWVMTNVKMPYKNLIGKWILGWARKVNRIIFVSNYEKKWFERNCAGDLGNLVTIRNGVDDEYEKYVNIEPKKNSFCYVGRLVDYKGIREMIEAFSSVDGKLELYIYGDGAEGYEKMVKDYRVHFMGYTDNPLLAIAQNEVFILASYYEGMSLALVEAAMMGKIIIASSVDGNTEVVKNMDTGILVPAKNEKKLSEAIDYVIRNPIEAKRMAKNARKLYEKDFNFDRIFKESMLPIYEDIK